MKISKTGNQYSEAIEKMAQFSSLESDIENDFSSPHHLNIEIENKIDQIIEMINDLPVINESEKRWRGHASANLRNLKTSKQISRGVRIPH